MGHGPLGELVTMRICHGSNHPRYKIRMEKGATVWTNTRESWLRPRPAPGQFTEDQDDPFKELRSDSALTIGSYGLHIDSHLGW